MFLIVVKKCLRAPLETVGSHFHKSYVTNNASALFIRQPKNQSTITFWPQEAVEVVKVQSGKKNLTAELI